MENTIRVLIADEDKEFCAMLRETFCIDERMEIIGTYGDGNGLAQRILQDAPDVVLMDLVLPGVDGLTVLHELNEAEPAKMPVIFVVSSFASQETTEECNALGVSFYLRKPVDLQALAQRVCRYGGQRNYVRSAAVRIPNEELEIEMRDGYHPSNRCTGTYQRISVFARSNYYDHSRHGGNQCDYKGIIPDCREKIQNNILPCGTRHSPCD